MERAQLAKELIERLEKLNLKKLSISISVHDEMDRSDAETLADYLEWRFADDITEVREGQFRDSAWFSVDSEPHRLHVAIFYTY